MSLKDKVARLMGRSVVDLAQAVDDALAHLAYCRGQRAEIQEALRVADEDVAQAEAMLATRRDALFQEHPELAGSGAPSPAPDPVAVPAPAVPHGLNPAAFDPVPIEVDDDMDPRFTDGAGAAPSPNDDDPLPSVVWEEHDE